MNIEDRTCTLNEASIHNEREYFEVDEVETTKALMTTNVNVKRNISLNLSSRRKRSRSPSADQHRRKKARSEPRERHSPIHWRHKTAEGRRFEKIREQIRADLSRFERFEKENERFEKEKERLVRSANFGEEARKLLEAPLSSSSPGVPPSSSSSSNEGSFVQLQNDAEEIDLTKSNSPKSNSTMSNSPKSNSAKSNSTKFNSPKSNSTKSNFPKSNSTDSDSAGSNDQSDLGNVQLATRVSSCATKTGTSQLSPIIMATKVSPCATKTGASQLSPPTKIRHKVKEWKMENGQWTSNKPKESGTKPQTLQAVTDKIVAKDLPRLSLKKETETKEEEESPSDPSSHLPPRLSKSSEEDLFQSASPFPSTKSKSPGNSIQTPPAPTSTRAASKTNANIKTSTKISIKTKTKLNSKSKTTTMTESPCVAEAPPVASPSSPPSCPELKSIQMVKENSTRPKTTVGGKNTGEDKNSSEELETVNKGDVRRKIKENIGTLQSESMKPSIGQFVDLYLDWKEAMGETSTASEGDEALIGVSTLVGESVDELFEVFRNTWTESTSKEELLEEFRKRYILVEYDSVSEFPLILDVLLFHFKRSKLVIDSKAAESGSVDTSQSSSTVSDASKTDDKIETASVSETSSQTARPMAASQIRTSETGSKHKTAQPTSSPAKTSKTIPTTKNSSSRSRSTVTSQTKRSTKRTTTTTAKNSSALSSSAVTSQTTKSTKTTSKSPKETSPVIKSQSKKTPATNPLVITVTKTGHKVEELCLPSPVPSLPSSSTPATNSQSKKKVFQKIEWCEEGEIISDGEESETCDFRRTKNEGYDYKTMRPVHERLGHDLALRDGTASSASACDIGRVDDATSFKPEIAELKAALSEILFMQPGRRTTVDNLSAIYRSHFYKSFFPIDHGFSVNSTSSLLFSLNLFSFEWKLGDQIVMWNRGKFLANFKANAEDLLQAKRSIQVFHFLPTYMKIFCHKVTEGLFLEMCGYPSTSELLRACCPSIWVPDFDHQRLQICDERDNSDFEEIDFGYEKKICYYFQHGWCKFGHTCRNIH